MAANGIVDSASYPSTDTTCTPGRSAVAAANSVVFPIPGSPEIDSAPPRPLRALPSTALMWRSSS